MSDLLLPVLPRTGRVTVEPSVTLVSGLEVGGPDRKLRVRLRKSTKEEVLFGRGGLGE